MKKFLLIAKSTIYGVIASLLLWLIFHWVTPYVMSITSFVMYLGCLFIEVLLTSWISTSASSLLSDDSEKDSDESVIENSKISKAIIGLPFIVFGILAAIAPWHYETEFPIFKYLLAIPLSATIGITFGGVANFLFRHEASKGGGQHRS